MPFLYVLVSVGLGNENLALGLKHASVRLKRSIIELSGENQTKLRKKRLGLS